MMSTQFEWTDAVWNPVAGISRVSPGCDHCYALSAAHRMKDNPGFAIREKYAGTTAKGKGGIDWTGRINLGERVLDEPRHWHKPRRIFVNSMSDLFHSNVPDEFIERIFGVIAECHRHIFQVLTKRPGRMLAFCSSQPVPPNCWLGVSVESQEHPFRLHNLKRIDAPMRFVSCEPLLGPLELDLEGLDWVIAGGESGQGYRPMHPDWARSLRDQCLVANVPFFFKQWGGTEKIDGSKGGHVLEGETWRQFPRFRLQPRKKGFGRSAQPRRSEARNTAL